MSKEKGMKAEQSWFDVYDVVDDETSKTTSAANHVPNDIWAKINDHVEEILNTVGDEEPGDDLSISCRISKLDEASPPRGSPEVETDNRILPVGNSKYTSYWSNRKQVDNNPNVLRKSMLELVNADIDDRLISTFRQGMHCSDTCIVRVVDRCGILKQSLLNRTISMVCIDRSRLESFVSKIPDNYQLRITRLQNTDAITNFQTSRVFSKRSVIKGGDILRTLAVFEIRENFDVQYNLQKKENKKVLYNKFTNMQRLDRGVGSRLKWKFMERHEISETDTIQVLEHKANVSFSIFKRDGYLSYESKAYRKKHVTMIESSPGLYYFIPTKMLPAFGSQWTHKRRTRALRYFTEQLPEGRKTSSVMGFHPQRLHLRKNSDPVRVSLVPGSTGQEEQHQSPTTSSNDVASSNIVDFDRLLEVARLATSPEARSKAEKHLSTRTIPNIKCETTSPPPTPVATPPVVAPVKGEPCYSNSNSSKRSTPRDAPRTEPKKLKLGDVTLKVMTGDSPNEGTQKTEQGSDVIKTTGNYITGEILSTSNDHVILRIPVSSIVSN